MSWKASIKKRNVQRGEEYVTKSGKTIPAKIFKAQDSCPCRLHCSQKIDVATQKKLFEQYYRLNDWTQKTLYLRSLTKRIPVKESFNPIISRRKNVCKYFLSDSNGTHQQVCLAFLSKCLSVPGSKIKTTIKYAEKNPSAQEQRGKFATKKFEEHDLNFLRQFIKSFPSYESHYKISASKKKYLSPFLNIRRMYKEYALKCSFMKKKICLPEWKFRDIFNKEFVLSFRRPKIDTCRKCDNIKSRLQSEPNASTHFKLLNLRDEHMKIVDKTWKQFNDCVTSAKIPENKEEVLTFDLQRALEVPSISTSQAFYTRQLWCYNLCVYDEVRRIGYMYLWDETVASRGSQEISSCLYKFFSNHIPKDTKKITLYSDSCGGQNRNIKMSMMLINFLQNRWKCPSLNTIEQRFFVSGHSYNMCDSCFAVIMKQRKITENVFVPKHWYQLIAQAKKKEPKYIVYEMKRKDFYSVTRLMKLITNRKKSIKGEKISWLKC